MTKQKEALPIESYVYEPPLAADASVIWLHGLGADGQDFAAIIDQLGLPDNHAVRFIFPNAPLRPITVNGGLEMRGWYDIYSLELMERVDTGGIFQSSQIIQQLIEQEILTGIKPARILLAGFRNENAGKYLSLFADTFYCFG